MVELPIRLPRDSHQRQTSTSTLAPAIHLPPSPSGPSFDFYGALPCDPIKSPLLNLGWPASRGTTDLMVDGE